MNYRIEKRRVTLEEYQLLRSTTGWDMLDDLVVEKALKNDLFSICIFDESQLIGMGRVIGDGAIYFYIQDVIVHPNYQGIGIGEMLMQNIEEYLSEAANTNSFIGLMAAAGVSPFYERFGYEVRPENRPGMYKVIK